MSGFANISTMRPPDGGMAGLSERSRGGRILTGGANVVSGLRGGRHARDEVLAIEDAS
ncbi:hypothetical protein SAMN06265360_11387 [Haloechinothrix alba]|uniref:Uncharacterized protein n=1 Tax=Haloechinothrix alba TaxID=664784 RepID=A0A238Y3U4_9PSEU|nr:hypothetical protein [Haloechinothrix alba]SNR65498.1 hypothetical protein SAMN06265360_11387 [Haloechinothrix alba]